MYKEVHEKKELCLERILRKIINIIFRNLKELEIIFIHRILNIKPEYGKRAWCKSFKKTPRFRCTWKTVDKKVSIRTCVYMLHQGMQ